MVFFVHMPKLVLIYYVITKNYVVKIKLRYATYLIRADVTKGLMQNSKYNGKLPKFSHFNQKKLIQL